MNQPLPGPAARPFAGIAFIVVAVACFAALDTSTKLATLAAPVAMAIWLRFLIQTVVTGAVLLPQRGLGLLRTGRPVLQFVRGALLLTCSVVAFYSLRHVHVGEFTAIVMLTPLVMTVVAAFALGERVSWLRWSCVSAGFVGTLIVIRPGEDLFRWAMLLPLLLVAANTAFQILTSRLAQTDDAGTTHFCTGLSGVLIASAALPFAWQALPWAVWAVLALIGAFGTLGHFLLILAYARAPVAVLTPYLYLQIAFATLGGWAVFDHVPDGWAMTGIAIVSAGGVFGTWLTGREALQRSRSAVALAALGGADCR